MGRAYDPTHYEMGLTTAALTFKAIQANEGHDPRSQDRGHWLHDQQDYNSPTTSLGDQETMTKAMMRPCRIGRMANHHCANGVVTTDTVAPRHLIPRRGHKTMMTTMPGRALHQDKMTFLAGQVS
jgi:hypothetical protein